MTDSNYDGLAYLQPQAMLIYSCVRLETLVVQSHVVFGRRASSSAAPQIWNHIPAAIKVSPSPDSFKRHLKTHYFTSP